MVNCLIGFVFSATFYLDYLEEAVISIMAKSAKKQAPTQKTKDEAMQVAKATQRPGQTKEQTRLIAQGIQKGVEHYKKQQKAKARELDKKLKQLSRQPAANSETQVSVQEVTLYKQHWLPWVLLATSWIGFVAYFNL